jgi:hypothetical protein
MMVLLRVMRIDKASLFAAGTGLEPVLQAPHRRDRAMRSR